MEGASAGKPRGRPRKQQPQRRTQPQRQKQPQQLQLQAQRQSQEADCIVAAVISEKEVATAIPEEAQKDMYEPGTAPPRAHQRSIDALDAVDPEVEDTHDALLAEGEAEARLAREDAAASLQEDDEGEEQGTTTED
ncbi:hypothetical protein N658DRAFT_569986 [Parathielavia hyrcaniae]|uniref:Uncharacterized protein n=1 Tax=Parathielavia hyrcaniae TaxID=113614 RepID=A0AAN6SXA0_9PEZI|nr:hypothetical protein N658DRAFT_569986 [Parathielavia hyrcaniae]